MNRSNQQWDRAVFPVDPCPASRELACPVSPYHSETKHEDTKTIICVHLFLFLSVFICGKKRICDVVVSWELKLWHLDWPKSGIMATQIYP